MRGGRGGSNTNRQIAGDIFGQKLQKGTKKQSNESDFFNAKYVSLGYLTSLGLEYIIDDNMFKQL